MTPRRLVKAEIALAAFEQAPQVAHERFRADLGPTVDQDPTPRSSTGSPRLLEGTEDGSKRIGS